MLLKRCPVLIKAQGFFLKLICLATPILLHKNNPPFRNLFIDLYMPTNNYLTFQEFETREDAEKIAQALEDNNIPVSIEKTPDLLDNVIIGKQYNNY